MTLRELLDTLKSLGATLTLHDGDAISTQPPDVLTPAVRAALTEHHAALVALIRSGAPRPRRSPNPSLEVLERLAKALGVPVTELPSCWSRTNGPRCPLSQTAESLPGGAVGP
jgi:hypothetical protein